MIFSVVFAHQKNNITSLEPDTKNIMDESKIVSNKISKTFFFLNNHQHTLTKAHDYVFYNIIIFFLQCE